MIEAPDHHQSNENSDIPQAAEKSLFMRFSGAPMVPFGTLSAVGLPVGVTWANWFALLNAISWSIVLGSPLVLYAKSLGCGDAALGILASLPPILAILHLPGAYLMPRFGYRRLMITGWASRSFLILALALSILLIHNDRARLGWLFVCIAIFSALRGITGGAWMPWVTALVPPDVRGRFFSRDQLYGQTGNLMALLAAAIFMVGKPRAWQFAMAFLFAGTGGFASLACLIRMPEISTPQQHAHNSVPVRLVDMARHGAFTRLCAFNIFYMLVIGGLNVFTVAFLSGVDRMPESSIVLLSGLAVIGGLISLFWCGAVIDRIGSRPIINLGVLAFILIFIGWWALAARIIPLWPPMVGLLYLLMGIAGLNFAVANNRLQSLSIPSEGRNHYFAVFSVAVNLAAGVSPMICGLILEAINAHHAQTGAVAWNRYSIYFAAGSILGLPLLAMSRRLDEKVIIQTTKLVSTD